MGMWDIGYPVAAVSPQGGRVIKDFPLDKILSK